MDTKGIKPISSILIANRGEISSRISRTCRKMGIRSIAVYSDADRYMPFVSDADEAIHIGESMPSKSYLDQDKIIAAAKRMQADAIHPGYGFLSENVSFAKRCKQEGLVFIGPNPEAIDAMGSKSKAKDLMKIHGVPTVPGYQGANQDIDHLVTQAEKVGYPLLLKAAAGGGGKGMRIVHESRDLKNAIDAAKRESINAFGDDELIIEKYVESGRHIEFQIFGDKQGNAIHLLERECTIQRRYQKVVEESPSPVLTQELRNQMGTAAVNAAKALNYDNAGTVEFIFDDVTQDFYFLEVNTRLQVEHPVTECVTGLDLVKMQIESAMGKTLTLTQDDVKGNGYAIEVRLYAEDPANNFNPVTGSILQFAIPTVDGLRVDSAVATGSEISMYYDPMIAKVIVHDDTRQGAHQKLAFTLNNMICSGMTTNQAFLKNIISNEQFQQGLYDTHFIEKHPELLDLTDHRGEAHELSAIAASLYQWGIRNDDRTLLKSLPSGWRNSFYDFQNDSYTIDDQEIKISYKYDKGTFVIRSLDNTKSVVVISTEANKITLEIDGRQTTFNVNTSDGQYFIQSSFYGSFTLKLKPRLPIVDKEKIKGGYASAMPAQVVKVLIVPGQEVKSGDPLVVLSSMKMESTILSTENGLVEEVYVIDNQNIESGYLMLKITELPN